MRTTESILIETNTTESRRGLIGSIFKELKQYDVVAQEVKGRQIRVSKDHWVTDFASCNYLGLDLHPDTPSLIQEEIKRWGTHPSWCRLVASPQIYLDLEEHIASLLGTEAAVMIPTVTLISLGVLPALVGKSGLLILDKTAHETMYEAAKVARDSGATLKSYPHDDYEALEEILKEHHDNPRKVIMIDGVYSMSGDYADIEKLSALAKEYGALLYIDDAHGFGVIGESPDADNPYGHLGNGIVKYRGQTYDNLLYVGGCSKAYSSLAAFVACSHEMRVFIQSFATPYDLSGPSPTASLATLKSGFAINEREGATIRKRLHSNTRAVKEGLQALGYMTMNTTDFPIVAVTIGDQEKLLKSANMLFDEGILVTVAPFPMVKKGDESHRISVTAANTDDDIARLLQAFKKVKEEIIEA